MSISAPPPELDTSDCLEAIALGTRTLAGQVPDEGPFKLVAVTNLLKGVSPPRGPRVWELTFKPTRMIPQDETGLVGAGGELIVRIDLASDDNPVRVIRGE